MKIKIIFPSEDVIGKVIFLGGLNLYNWIKSKDHAINVKSLLISQILLYTIDRDSAFIILPTCNFSSRHVFQPNALFI